MRLSRPRLLLRAALLGIGGAFMAWKAVEAHRGAREVSEAERLLLDRLALVWALVATLALATAAAALVALRRRPRSHSLHLPARRRGAGPEP